MTTTIPTVIPKAPRYLRAPTKRWWRSVVTTWDLDEHHVRLLTLAGEAWDRNQRARELLERDGDVVTTKAGGPRAHPAVGIARDAAIVFSRLVRELDLDLGSPSTVEAKRPPALRSIR